MALFLPLLFLALLVLGAPIYLTMGVTSALMFGSEGNLMAFAQKVIDELNSNSLLAVPYFIIAASFMERGGVAKALINAANAWVGWLPGGLGLVSVLSCTIFAAMCGSSVATAIAMGTILVPAMLKAGYKPGFASGIVGASGTLGILIPPSLALVVYGVLADISIPRLFLAGVIPGLLQSLLLATYILWIARRQGYKGNSENIVESRLLTTFKAIPALLVPLLVLGGMYGGFVTLTESAALSAIVAIVLSLFVYKGIELRELIDVMAHAVKSATVIVIIIAMAIAFGHWVTETGIAQYLVGQLEFHQVKGWQFLIVINIMLLFLGMFLEVYSVLLLMVPILLPLLNSLNIDPIHFGILLVINMEIALLTPPVGLNLFVISNISGIPLSQVVKGTLPFVLLMLLLLILVTYVPILSLFLPNLLLGT